MLDLYDLVRVSEFALGVGEESFRVRLELARSRSSRRTFRASVRRAELYRIQSAFPLKDGRPAHEPSDEIVLVDWSGILRRFREPFSAPSVAEAERLVLDEVDAWLCHSRGECEGDANHIWAECRGGRRTPDR
jgi:hypothetical protein